MSLAILCSGQGTQHPDMFRLTGQAPEAAAVFAHATHLLGGDPRSFVRDQPREALQTNRTGQLLCAVQALAAGAFLQDFVDGDLIVAGYSVGEVPTWGIAGLIEPKHILDLIVQRADAMDAAGQPGEGLLFIRGLSRAAIDPLCMRCKLDIAIINPGNAFVLGGDKDGLDAAEQAAQQSGAERVVRLGVAVASHTPRLAEASRRFRAALDHVPIASKLSMSVRLISGIDAAPVLDIGEGLDKLAAQISQAVQWSDCLAACVEAGASVFLELGPGRALAEMAAGAYPQIPARSLEDFRTLEGLRTWLGRFLGR